MIDHLKHMAVFARVVEEGSFRAAAKSLDLAPSRVSEIVSELEDYVGITLLYRSTRKLALTNEGTMFHARVSEMLERAETGLNELNASAVESAGALRISLPAFLASGPLTTAVAGFATSNPNVNISVVYTDQRMQLIEDGLDMSIRVGWLDDSALMSRKLATGTRHLVAGKEYAQQWETPVRPADLRPWKWIRVSHHADNVQFTSASGNIEVVKTSAQVEVDSVEAMYHLCKQNIGAAILPSFLADRGVASGEFVRLLPTWSLKPLGIYAVWPDKSRRENLTLQFIRYLADQGLCEA